MVSKACAVATRTSSEFRYNRRTETKRNIDSRDWGMRIASTVLIAALAMMGASGCASVVHSGPREIAIASQPPGAQVSIYNRENELVTSQTTPFVAQLSPKRRFFQGQTYRVVFEKEGFSPTEVQLEPKVSAWYFGNILLGGPVGMFIVDPATGFMFNLVPDEVDQTLVPAPASTLPSD